jgi:[NiFe] hydrogenase diaphorase moiety small subunit
MPSFRIDDQAVEFSNGQTIMQAAMAAGIFIPHLCYHPEFVAHGSCRLCVVEIDGHLVSSCTTAALEDTRVHNITNHVQQHRKQLLELLFVEGNHICPGCEKSGACTLQSVAEFCGMLAPPYTFQYPDRKLDASHKDFILDFNRCINCELCVRASRDVDHKSVFAITGRGQQAHLIVNAEQGLLANSSFEKTDRAASICPVGVILPKHKGFEVPFGQRKFDVIPVNEQQAGNDEK